jgi:hypothetical protein
MNTNSAPERAKTRIAHARCLTKFGHDKNQNEQFSGGVVLERIINAGFDSLRQRGIVNKLYMPKGSRFPGKDLLINPQVELVCHVIGGGVTVSTYDGANSIRRWHAGVEEQFLVPVGGIYCLESNADTRILVVSIGDFGWHPMGHHLLPMPQDQTRE